MTKSPSAPTNPGRRQDRLPETCDALIVGAGIVGLATAYRLSERHPRARIVVIEKEGEIGVHQSGRNSNVIHAGVYYKPGSLRAAMCRSGKQQLERFLLDEGLPFKRCGKLIVATSHAELPRLDAIGTRAAENGVRAERVDGRRLREIEPACSGVAALHVAESGVTDYRLVMRRLAEILERRGHSIVTNCRLEQLADRGESCVAKTSVGGCEAGLVIACAGLHSDRVARKSGLTPRARIVPFRGEYFELAPTACHLVRGLIYPVPDPTLPFLGVHLTITAGGGVECGPNAVLAFAREGYRFSDVRAGDLLETLSYPGFWRLARKHWRSGIAEMRRSLDPAKFCRSLQNLVPAIEQSDLTRVPAGVRAQAVARDGSMVDDFVIVRRGRMLHVCNAPSPAATASLAIADRLIDEAQDALSGW